MYKSDGSTKKGCFEKCAKYAVWCVRSKFGHEYIYKEKKDKSKSNAKRRRNLVSLDFDPMINLRKNRPEKKEKVSEHDKQDAGAVVEVSPSPGKKRLTQSEMEYNVKEMVVQSLRSYFLASPGSCISTVDEFKNVRII